MTCRKNADGKPEVRARNIFERGRGDGPCGSAKRLVAGRLRDLRDSFGRARAAGDLAAPGMIATTLAAPRRELPSIQSRARRYAEVARDLRRYRGGLLRHSDGSVARGLLSGRALELGAIAATSEWSRDGPSGSWRPCGKRTHSGFIRWRSSRRAVGSATAKRCLRVGDRTVEPRRMWSASCLQSSDPASRYTPHGISGGRRSFRSI